MACHAATWHKVDNEKCMQSHLRPARYLANLHLQSAVNCTEAAERNKRRIIVFPVLRL